MPFTAFISDLHLTSERPEVNEIFFDFLRGPARAADALYILGDLFEYWAGDDDLADPLNASVAGGLLELSRSGVPVMLMHGNRDLLMLHGFERAAGVKLIADPTVVDLYGTATLLMHGDTLCRDDHQYQRIRARIRSPWWQRLFLLQPLWLRRAEIERARRMSEHSKQTKPLWLVITGVATAIGLGTAASGSFAVIGILSVVAFVAAAIYLTDVRPKVKDFRTGGSGSHMGPYGPW